MEEIWNGKQMTAYRHAIVWQGLGKKCSLEALYGRMPHELLYGMSRSFPGRGRKAGLEPLRVIK